MPHHATAPLKHGSAALLSRRVFELGAIFVAAALLATTAYLAFEARPAGSVWMPLGFLLLGLVASDAISGTVHWVADTYGSPTMPVFGSFVRTFREHHGDPKAITRHDWIEANGDVCLFSAPVHAGALFWVDDPFVLSWMTGLFMGSYSNSQIHKWAHMDQPPRVVSWLQRLRIVLSSSHHQQHHRGPHLTHYCITTGWTNGVLDYLRCFRILERLLGTFGIQPSTRGGVAKRRSVAKRGSVAEPVGVQSWFEGRPD